MRRLTDGGSITCGVSAWQPILTAPPDGQVLVAYRNGAISIGPGRHGLAVVEEGFDSDWTPTHWMPLPEPPED